MNNQNSIPKINTGFTNDRGTYYDKVREIAYQKGELFGNLGVFVTETEYISNCIFDDTKNPTRGVYIYQSYSNPEIAYRIYKAFADCGFDGYEDDKLIQKLSERQKNINLSKFPTGVVTLSGKIIGQEIPYYANDITLFEFFNKYKNINPIKIYYAVLEILNELYYNGIIYLDTHPKNFMINLLNEYPSVDIIDFEYSRIIFDDDSEVYRKLLFCNYKIMVNKLNEMLGITDIVGKFSETQSFDDTYHQLSVMKKKLTM